jgi:hypothetical protein
MEQGAGGQGACPERKSKDRFIARLASETFLSSLKQLIGELTLIAEAKS